MAQAVLGSVEFDYGEHRISFAKFEQLTMKEAVLKYWPSEVEALTLPQLDDAQVMAARIPALNGWLSQRGARR